MLTALGISVGFLFFAPPIPQLESYHAFAAGRAILGIPNFWNVVSNAPFAVVGVLGLRKSRDAASRMLFAGVLLTAFGSAYYHSKPNDARLVWDRLPMTLVFMSLLAMVTAEWIGPEWERRLLIPLTLYGIASVLWWNLTGDLRPYAVAQYGPLLILLPALRFVPKARVLAPVLALYVLAKLAESYDEAIYSVVPLSGHTLKHFAAALATAFVLRWRS